MKKIFSIFAALAVLTTSIIFTACDTSGLSDILAPEDTWYVVNIQKGDENAGYIGVIYSENGIPKTTKSNRLAIDIPAGITVIAWADDSSNTSKSMLSGLNKNTYIMKNFGKDKQTEKDIDDEEIQISGSRATWGLIYTTTAVKNSKEKYNALNDGPNPVLKNSGFTELTGEIKETLTEFSWRKLLRDYLISTL